MSCPTCKGRLSHVKGCSQRNRLALPTSEAPDFWADAPAIAEEVVAMPSWKRGVPPAAPELPHRLFGRMETLSDELCQTQAFILRALARAGLSIVDAKDRAVLDACAELSTDNLETFGKPIGFGTKWQRFAWAELARREVKP